MKYILPLILFVAGCTQTNIVKPSIEEDYNVPAKATLGNANGIYWSCVQETITENLVWDRCVFENKSRVQNNVCINII